MDFQEDGHIYSKNGRKYQSVSEFLKQFKKEFPKNAVAAATAKRDGREAQEILDEWELNAQISRNYGTTLHQGIEYWLKYGKIHKLAHIEQVVKAFEAKYDRKRIHSEIIVDNDEFGLAGTIDQLYMIESKKVNVIDLKTNAELSHTGKGSFLAPLDKLPFSKINEYRLQLSSYKTMLELKGYEVVDLMLEHWNGRELVTIPLEPIDMLPFFQASVGGEMKSNIHSKKTVRI
jgi:hypothetical protein